MALPPERGRHGRAADTRAYVSFTRAVALILPTSMKNDRDFLIIHALPRVLESTGTNQPFVPIADTVSPPMRRTT